jgi:hypothetical protein
MNRTYTLDSFPFHHVILNQFRLCSSRLEFYESFAKDTSKAYMFFRLLQSIYLSNYFHKGREF